MLRLKNCGWIPNYSSKNLRFEFNVSGGTAYLSVIATALLSGPYTGVTEAKVDTEYGQRVQRWIEKVALEYGNKQELVHHLQQGVLRSDSLAQILGLAPEFWALFPKLYKEETLDGVYQFLSVVPEQTLFSFFDPKHIITLDSLLTPCIARAIQRDSSSIPWCAFSLEPHE